MDHSTTYIVIALVILLGIGAVIYANSAGDPASSGSPTSATGPGAGAPGTGAAPRTPAPPLAPATKP